MLALSPALGRRRCSVFARSSILRCGAAAALPRRRGHSGDARRASSISQALERAAGAAPRGRWFRSCSPTTRPASIQPVARSGRDRACGRRPAARRCGAGRRAASPCDIQALGADLLTLSAHKIGGPQGVGALIRRDELARSTPLITRRRPGARRRAGTENVAGDRRLRRGRRGGAASLRRRRPAAWRRCATGWKPGSRPSRPRPSFSAPRRRGCPTRRCFAVPGMKAETARDRLRSRRRRGVVGLGLLVRQGRAVACAGRHGRRAGRWRAARSASVSAMQPPRPMLERF